jgi:hypothetical protein
MVKSRAKIFKNISARPLVSHKFLQTLYATIVATATPAPTIAPPVKSTKIARGQDHGSIPKGIDLSVIKNTSQWRFKIGAREYNLFIGDTSDRDQTVRAIMIYRWLTVAEKYAKRRECSQKMNIYIYMTNQKKILPNAGEEIEQIHVNTAFTTSCKTTTEIHLFRAEEWFKVFIHETFHALGLDFSEVGTSISINTTMGRVFALQPAPDFLLFEAYTELMAEIIAIMFAASSWEACSAEIMKQQNFSIYQACKILHFTGLSYSNLIRGNAQSYREKSPVFSYYIIKSVLLFFLDDFAEWCKIYNTNTLLFNQNNITEFCNFIKEHAARPEFVGIIEQVRAHANGSYDTSLRMTLLDDASPRRVRRARSTQKIRALVAAAAPKIQSSKRRRRRGGGIFK